MRAYLCCCSLTFRPVRTAARQGDGFSDELLRGVETIRAQIGCLDVQVFGALREPFAFAIHSEWVNEVTFELHAQFATHVRFLEAAEPLLTRPMQGLRFAADRGRHGGRFGGRCGWTRGRGCEPGRFGA